jgi:hypothetical protein
MKIEVKTIYDIKNKTILQKTIFHDDFLTTPNHARITESIIRLQDEGVAEALVKLGWTPPNNFQTKKIEVK